MPRIGLIAAAALVLLAGVPAGAAAAAKPVMVKPSNPLYPVLEAFGSGSVELGATVRGCRLLPLTSCAGADLAGSKLTGAVLTSRAPT